MLLIIIPFFKVTQKSNIPAILKSSAYSTENMKGKRFIHKNISQARQISSAVQGSAWQMQKDQAQSLVLHAGLGR